IAVPLLVLDHLEDVPRGHTAKRVKTIFREMKAVPCPDSLPGAPVNRHRVDERAVEIKNQSARMFERAKHCRCGVHKFIAARRSSTSCAMSGSMTGSRSPSMVVGRL